MKNRLIDISRRGGAKSGFYEFWVLVKSGSCDLYRSQSHFEARTGLASIEVRWPWLNQNSIVTHKSPCMQSLKSFSPRAELQAPLVQETRLCSPPFIKTRAAEDLKSISFLSPSVGKRQVVSALLYRQSGFILLIQHLTNGTYFNVKQMHFTKLFTYINVYPTTL